MSQDLITCRKCGRIHPRGFKCTVPNNKGYSTAYRKDAEAYKFRSSRKWKNKRQEIKERSGNLCAVCLANGILTYKGLEVHHIEKVEDNYDARLDDDNLICLCSSCHHKAEAGEISKDYLRQLARKRDEDIG